MICIAILGAVVGGENIILYVLLVCCFCYGQSDSLFFSLLKNLVSSLGSIAVCIHGSLTLQMHAEFYNSGALLPFFALLFGEFTDAFGSPSASSFMPIVKDLALKFLYIGLGEFILSWLSIQPCSGSNMS